MGELQHEPFQFAFNGFLKVAFQGSRITSDAGILLVRELDERLGLETLIDEHLMTQVGGGNGIAGFLPFSPPQLPSRRDGPGQC